MTKPKQVKIMTEEHRENWLDLAKAIGIILVVLAHALPKDNYLWIYINNFHMPLFFCVSGYLYQCKGKCLTYVVKKIRTLWFPFVWSSLITYFIFLFTDKNGFSIKEVLKIIIMSSPGPLLGALWFLPVLLFTSVFYDLLFRLIKHIKFLQKTIVHDIVITLFCTVCLVIGLYTSLPYMGSVILRSMFFYQVGQLFRRSIKYVKYELIVGILLLAILTLVSFFNSSSYINNTYTHISLFIISSLNGSLGICLLCRFTEKIFDIKKLRLLLYIGKNSIGPLIWQFVSFKLITLIQILIYKLPYEKINEFPVLYDYAYGIWVVLDVIAGIVISMIIYLLINKPIDKLLLKAEKGALKC